MRQVRARKIVLKIGFFAATEFYRARLTDAIEGEKAQSLIFPGEKFIRTRRRFNYIKTNVDLIEVPTFAISTMRNVFERREVDRICTYVFDTH